MKRGNYPKVKCGILGCKRMATYIHTYYSGLSMCNEHFVKFSATNLRAIKSELRSKASRENGKKGGRPKKAK